MTLRDLIQKTDLAGRRTFLSGMASSMLGVSAGATFGPRAIAAALGQNPAQDPAGRTAAGQQPDKPILLGRASAKHVIYLFMRGGMSHLDTFDPKPGKATQGPTEALRTRADGVLLGQYFPLLAEQMDKVCLVSSMQSRQGAHEQAQYVMRTSFEMRGTIKAKEREMPLVAKMSALRATRSSTQASAPG